MRLAHLFLLVSAVTLVIPWAGCQYVRDMEQALRHGQAEALAATASITARTLADHTSLQTVDPRRFADLRTSAADVLAYPLAAAPDIDGYADDWSLPAGSLETVEGPADLRVRYQAGRTRTSVYLFLEVSDAEVIYGTQPESDRVRVRVRNRDGLASDLLFVTPAPGLVRPVGKSGQTHRRVQANWQPTSRGFNLEIRLPAEMSDLRLGFLVTDHDPGTPPASTGTMPDLFSEPGWLVQTLDDIEGELRRLVRTGQRLSLIDPAGYILADAGSVADTGRSTSSGIVHRLIRLAVGGPAPGEAVRHTRPGRADTQPIMATFLGRPVDLRLATTDVRRVVLTSTRPLPIGDDVNLALVAEEDSELLLSLTDTAASRLLISTLSVSLAATVVLLGFAAWLSWRIRRLSRASRILIDDRQPGVRALPDARAADELGDLSRDLSHLLSRVSDYNAYLESLGKKLTHELRTPLAIVRTSLENLQAETDVARGHVYMDRARQGVERMQAIVTALGAATKIEQAVSAAEMETFDLGVLVSDLSAAYRASHPMRKIDARVAAAPCPIHGAPELIAQMLDKLLDNALDFCPPDGTITIELAAREAGCRLGVSNTGSRLPIGQKGRLFDSLFSARVGDAGSPHLGLGLYIVQLIARHHGAECRAINLSENRGVGVFVTFPGQDHTPPE